MKISHKPGMVDVSGKCVPRWYVDIMQGIINRSMVHLSAENDILSTNQVEQHARKIYGNCVCRLIGIYEFLMERDPKGIGLGGDRYER